MSTKSSLGRFFTEYAVVIIFLVITLASIKPSGLSLVYIVQEIITRLGRNSFLVLAPLLTASADSSGSACILVDTSVLARAGSISFTLIVSLYIGGTSKLFSMVFPPDVMKVAVTFCQKSNGFITST